MTIDRDTLEQLCGALQAALQLDQCSLIEPAAETGLDSEDIIRLSAYIAQRHVADIVGQRAGRPFSVRERAILATVSRIFANSTGSVAGSPAVKTSPVANDRDSHEALLRVTREIARHDDVDTALETILIELERTVPFDTSSILTVDDKARLFIPRITRIGGELVSPGMEHVSFGSGLAGEVYDSGEPSLVPNAHRRPRSLYAHDLGPLARLLGESVMLAPLKVGESVAGIIVASRFGQPPFTRDEFELFRRFASQVEGLFASTIRLETERTARQHAGHLTRLAVELSGAETELQVTLSVVQAAREIVGVPHAWAGLYHDGTLSAEASIIDGEPGTSAAGPRPGTDAETREPLHMSVPTVIERFEQAPATLREQVDPARFMGAIVVPLPDGSAVAGELWLWTLDERPRPPATLLETLEALADVTRRPLERIRARDRAREVERVADMLTQSTQIALNAERDEAALDELVRLLHDSIGTRAISAWLVNSYDADGRPSQLRSAAQVGTETAPDAYTDPTLTLELIGLHEDWLGRMTIIPDARRSDLSVRSRRQCRDLGIGALIVLPLVDRQRLSGLVRLDYASARDLPEAGEINLAKGIVAQFGIGLASLRIRRQLMDLYRSSIEALAATVDAKDPYTQTHSRNVAFFSRLLAERMALSDEEIQQVELAGLLHDIGKIGIADRILTKDEPLDPQERVEMMAHPERGAHILSGHAGLAPLVPIVRYHHERYDGFGYPEGLRGDEIPLGAAIVAAADAFDTIVNERSYAPGRTISEARSELLEGAGSQFHPEVARQFVALIDERLNLIRSRVIDGSREQPSRARTDHLTVAEVAQVRVVSRLARELGSLTDLPTFIESACRIVADELGYSSVDICLADSPAESYAQATDSVASWCRAISSRVIKTNQVVNVPDVSLFPDFSVDIFVGSLLAVPLRVEEQTIGVLCVAHERRAAFTIVDEAILMVATNQLAAALRVARLHDQVKWSARHDALTSALNHGAFYEELLRAIEQHARTSQPASLMLCDVDGLKRVNDRLGHLAGDDLLRSLVARIREIVRPTDRIARYGGDEFAIITLGTRRDEAAEVATQIHRSLKRRPLLEGSRPVQVTIGIAQIGEDGASPAELVRVADERLYKERRRRARATALGN
jgi:diguanylate cyclase (GGDEF)-like protein